MSVGRANERERMVWIKARNRMPARAVALERVVQRTRRKGMEREIASDGEHCSFRSRSKASITAGPDPILTPDSSRCFRERACPKMFLIYFVVAGMQRAYIMPIEEFLRTTREPRVVPACCTLGPCFVPATRSTVPCASFLLPSAHTSLCEVSVCVSVLSPAHQRPPKR